MEKRINKKISEHMLCYKTFIKDKILESTTDNENIGNLIQLFYDYPTLILTKEDFQKRKRVKNVVPLHDRCCALKAANEQCTRRKKDKSDFCGTHIKGTPHGIVTNSAENNLDNTTIEKTKIVTAHDFNGIIYYIDDSNNVYDTVDIHNNKANPKVIAKYTIENDIYKIPEFNI